MLRFASPGSRLSRGVLWAALLLLAAAGAGGAAPAPASVTLRLPLYDVRQAAPAGAAGGADAVASAAPASVLLGGKEGRRVRVRLDGPSLRRVLVENNDLLGVAVRLKVKGQPGDPAGATLRWTAAGSAEPPVAVPLGDALRDGWLHLTRMARAVRGALKGPRGDVDLELSLDSPTGAALELVTPLGADPADAPFALLAVKERPKMLLFPGLARPWKGVYMQAQNGHLAYGGKRVRLWGVALAPSANGGRAARLRALGFNAVRITVDGLYSEESGKRGEMAPSRKGDGGRLDSFDRLIAEMRGQGIFVILVLPALRAMPGATLDGSFLQGGDDWKEWQAAVTGESNQAALGLNQFFDERLRQMRKRHLANFLNHVNPYTGKRYAEEECIAAIEMADGSDALRRVTLDGLNAGNDYFKKKVQAQWQEWLKRRYGSDEGLVKAWGALQQGESLASGSVKVEPSIWQRGSLPPARQQALLRFVAERAASLYRELRSQCRSLAPRGVGANVVPVVFDTQSEPCALLSYVVGQGDAVSLSASSLAPSTSLADPPGEPMLDEGSVAGKPTIVSGVSVSRPNPYRGELPLRIATLASWQDWDAVLFRTWDAPQYGRPYQASPEEYLLSPMPYPQPGLETQGTYSDTDPALAATMTAAGTLFCTFAVPPAAKPALYTLGQRALFSFTTARGVGMHADTYRRGARMAFAPERDVAVLVDGKPVTVPTVPEAVRKGAKAPPVAPAERVAIDPGRPPAGAVAAGGCIRWDWPAARLVVDAPQAKLYVGPWKNPCRFRDGLVLSGINVPWVAFAAVATDGKPLAAGASRVLVAAQANAVNTGFDMDLARFSPDQELPSGDNAVAVFRDPGHGPVQVDRVGYTLSFPAGLSGTLSGCDFALRPRLSRPVLPGGVLRVKGAESWLGVLAIAKRGGAARPVVDASVMPRDRSPIWGLGVAAQRRELAGLWFPIPGLSWRDDYQQMHRLVRQSPLLCESISNPERGDKPTRLLKMACECFGLPANVEITFTGEVPSQVVVAFRKTPEFDALVAAHRKELGAPQAVVPPAKPGELQTASWAVKSAAGELAVSIEAKSYQVKASYELKRPGVE